MTRVGDEDGKADPQTEQPRRFRLGWRFWIPREGGFVGSQCLWVDNTDAAPWKLGEVYQYVLPALGGDAAGDAPLTGEVPNYYLNGGAWVDKEAGVGVGCWYSDDKVYQCNYWRDPGGGFHADLRQKVDAVLEPGRRLEVSGVPAFIFPLRDVSRADVAEAIRQVEQRVLRNR